MSIDHDSRMNASVTHIIPTKTNYPQVQSLSTSKRLCEKIWGLNAILWMYISAVILMLTLRTKV